MDVSLLENFQKLVGTSLQSILEDLKIQYNNKVEELVDKIIELKIKTKEQEDKINDLTSKLEENDFNETNFNKVSIISNLNKQIRDLGDENKDLRNCLTKKIPINASLARINSPTPSEEAVEAPVEAAVEAAEVAKEAPVEAAVEAPVEVAKEAPVEAAEVAKEAKEAPVEAAEEAIEEVEAQAAEAAEVEEVIEIEYKNKNYYVIDNKLYNNKDGKKGKCVGKMVDGKPKLTKKKKIPDNSL
jgi:hypothetical protein